MIDQRNTVLGIVFFVSALTLVDINSYAHAQNDMILQSDPHRNFYQEYFTDCPTCSTISVLVSPSGVDNSVEDIFREVANQFGESHAASILDQKTYLINYKVFQNNNCEIHTPNLDTFLIYMDRRSKYCVKFPVSSENHLYAVISLISYHWEDPSSIKLEHKKFLANAIVMKYTEQFEQMKPVEDALISFLEYMAQVTKEFINKNVKEME